ncbi:MAG: glycosyl hydrolase 53 family protein [Alphaproteobacteria bacterium]|nr:glycosyl hydrolase 53 family protein [Alphaproteobacteria bacterium]
MKFFTAAFLGSLVLSLTPSSAHGFYFGADLSFANEMNDCGVVYRENGQPKDVFALFKEHGANIARIRIWADGNPTKYSNIEDVERSLRRAKEAGMTTSLDFHYSDWWADGGKQIIPAAWANIEDTNQLAKVLYQYTYDTLRTLDKAGLMPDIVQPGNEINHEILDKGRWKYGAINWKRNALLLNTAIKAVRDAGRVSSIRPKVMIQIAQPENVLPWFAAAVKAGVTDFDMIGISYYPKWSTDSLRGLGRTINTLRNRHPGVDVTVVETAYPWTTGKDSGLAKDNVTPGYPATPQGQKNFLIDLSQTVISNGGGGVLIWAPDWIPSQCTKGAAHSVDWEVMTFFGPNGEVLPGIDFMRQKYHWPVSVTFRFRGTVPKSGRTFYLWGDFFGDPDFLAFPVRREGSDLVYKTSIMPGTYIHFQLFGEKTMTTPLLSGSDLSDGVVSETVPNRDTVYEFDVKN